MAARDEPAPRAVRACAHARAREWARACPGLRLHLALRQGSRTSEVMRDQQDARGLLDAFHAQHRVFERRSNGRDAMIGEQKRLMFRKKRTKGVRERVGPGTAVGHEGDRPDHYGEFW